jgi:hypothetical protein
MTDKGKFPTNRFKVGQTVYAICADWKYDNPMIVTEAEHPCHCGCGYAAMCARGQSGAIHEEIEDVFIDEAEEAEHDRRI